MGEVTEIAWCRHTWNPWYGCTKVSPGCAHCYAEELMDLRYGKVGWGPGKPRKRTAKTTFHAPYKWNRDAKRRGEIHTVFALSLGDVYDPEVSDDWRTDMFRIILDTPNLIYLLLTKRPELINDFHDNACWPESGCPMRSLNEFPNVALGVSVENNDYRWRLTAALEQKCKVTFCSAEPLLGGLKIAEYMARGLSWVITGGESGGAARDCEIENIRDVGRQCAMMRIPWFNKQLGARATEAVPVGDLFAAGPHARTERIELPLVHKKGGDMQEWPADLRVQEQPDWEAIYGISA